MYGPPPDCKGTVKGRKVCVNGAGPVFRWRVFAGFDLPAYITIDMRCQSPSIHKFEILP